MLPANLSDFVVFLGTPAFVGFLAAHVLIFVPQYMALSPNAKQLVNLGLNILFAVVSLVIINLASPAALQQFQPFYALIVTFIMSWIGNGVTMNGILLNKTLWRLDK